MTFISQLSKQQLEGTLKMSLPCYNVPNTNILLNTYSFCIVYTRNSDFSWQIIGITGTIANEDSSKWLRNFNIDVDLAVLELRFEVYARDAQRYVLKDHDFIGQAEGNLLPPMLQQLSNRRRIELRHNLKTGRLNIAVDVIREPIQNMEVSFRICLSPRMRSKAFYQITKRTVGEQYYVPMLQSEPLNKTNCCFAPCSVELSELCAGLASRTFRIEFISVSPMGRSRILGFIKTNVDDLLNFESEPYELKWNAIQCGTDDFQVQIGVTQDSSCEVPVFNISVM